MFDDVFLLRNSLVTVRQTKHQDVAKFTPLEGSDNQELLDGILPGKGRREGPELC
jgi:hypothetical protein